MAAASLLQGGTLGHTRGSLVTYSLVLSTATVDYLSGEMVVWLLPLRIWREEVLSLLPR